MRTRPAYRKWFRPTWTDGRWLRLSPKAKVLWLCALTGPFTDVIPGLSVVHGGPVALASAAGLDPAEAEELWREIEATGMTIVADWPILWVPEYFVTDLDSGDWQRNPDSIKGGRGGWGRPWDAVPDGPQKIAVRESIDGFLAAYDDRRRDEAIAEGKPAPTKSYREAFRAACRRPAGANLTPEPFDATG